MTVVPGRSVLCNLVSALYSGVMSKLPWYSFVTMLRESSGADFCGLVVYRSEEDRKPYFVFDGTGTLFSCETGDTLALFEQASLVSVQENTRWGTADHLNPMDGTSELVSHEAGLHVEQTRVDLELLGGEHWSCVLCIFRRPERPGFGIGDRSLLQALEQDLVQALTLFSELDRSRTQGLVLQRAMDKLGIGTIFLNKHRRIVDINHEALSALERVDSVGIRDGSIYFRDPCRRRDFEASVTSALKQDTRQAEEGSLGLVSLESTDGEKLDVLVLPVGGDCGWGGDTGPAVVIYMQTLSIRRTIPKSLIAEAFGLSYVEAHLALLLSQGFTMESAADTLGIKVSTARSYSKNIYVKLGISRQVDLVRKVLRSVALLA